MSRAAEQPRRPVPLPVSPALIPEALRALPQWVTWRYTWKAALAKWDKPPLRASTGKAASSTNPQTWATFDAALHAYQHRDLDGVGVVLTETDDVAAFDLDHCRDPETGAITPEAQAIVDRLQSYTEVSPSAEGLRILCRGELPPGGRKKGDVEMYASGRYVTITGNHLHDTPLTIEPRQAAIDALHAEVFGPDPAMPYEPPPADHNGHAPPLDDDQLLEKALAAKNGAKFARLWAGDTSDYARDDNDGESEADLALCQLLAFWSQDVGQIDRLFRRSGLMRAKWDQRRGEQTYGQRTIATALSQAREHWQPGRGRAHRNGDEGAAATPDDGPHLTDRGNAMRLVRRFGDELHYLYGWEKWVVWRDGRWRMDDMGAVERCAKQVIADLYRWAKQRIDALSAALEEEGAASLADPEQRLRAHEATRVKAALSWALKSESTGHLYAMIRQAQSEPEIPLMHEQLDADAWVLNCQNGTLDLRTGRLRPHRRADLLTKMIPVAYDPQAACPRWWRFLREVMAGNQALIAYLQRAVGYSLTGSVQEQVLFFLHGAGQNGKSTFVNAILALLGDYGMQALPELLLVRTHEQHPTERADLFRKRLVATVEVEAGRRLAEALVKVLTGGERIRARRMREDFWEFDPSHKIWLVANHLPEIRGRDHAIWRRVKRIPFTVTIADDRKDATLPAQLAGELPGILNWALEGCRAWQRGGLQEPPEVTEAGQAYRQAMDVIGQFLDECCWVKPESLSLRTRSSVLHDAFVRWAGEHISQKAFSMQLSERGFTRKMGGDGANYWLGIGLIATDDTAHTRGGDT
jgi:putative DNA primase/helicase